MNMEVSVTNRLEMDEYVQQISDTEMLRIIEDELARRVRAGDPPKPTKAAVEPPRAHTQVHKRSSLPPQQLAPTIAMEHRQSPTPGLTPTAGTPTSGTSQGGRSSTSTPTFMPRSSTNTPTFYEMEGGAASARAPSSPKTSERVQVVVRVRPFIVEDRTMSTTNADFDCTSINGRQISVGRPSTYDNKEFLFDHCLPHICTQEAMYEKVGMPVVDAVLQGYNGTILAYGQTGTGKTHTLMGPDMDWDSQKGLGIPMDAGVIPLAIHHIFDAITHTPNIEYRVSLSCSEIYMESISDLLDLMRTNLPIREDPKHGVYVDNLTQVTVSNLEEALLLLHQCNKNRAKAATNMNKISSRSHVVITIAVEHRQSQRNEGGRIKRGQLTIVDLAGSERVGKSGSEGKRLDEAKVINRSLSALGNCVSALSDPNSTHIPFRDSKLTRLLSSSLGGNSKTCLCATIGPSISNYDETISTLLFATRAMSVQNHAVINETVDLRALSGTLEQKLHSMQVDNGILQNRITQLEQENQILRAAQGPWASKEAQYLELIGQLQAQVKALSLKVNDYQEDNGQRMDEMVASIAQGLLEMPALRGSMMNALQQVPPGSSAKSTRQSSMCIEEESMAALGSTPKALAPTPREAMHIPTSTSPKIISNATGPVHTSTSSKIISSNTNGHVPSYPKPRSSDTTAVSHSLTPTLPPASFQSPFADALVKAQAGGTHDTSAVGFAPGSGWPADHEPSPSSSPKPSTPSPRDPPPKGQGAANQSLLNGSQSLTAADIMSQLQATTATNSTAQKQAPSANGTASLSYVDVLDRFYKGVKPKSRRPSLSSQVSSKSGSNTVPRIPLQNVRPSSMNATVNHGLGHPSRADWSIQNMSTMSSISLHSDASAWTELGKASRLSAAQ